MVCVAAFIILCLVGVVVAFLSIFKPEIGKKYLTVFKKAWHCVFKKVRLQKCDTNFKEDVKNTILKKVILKHPKWVKPLSIIIEILSVLIVAITVWSLIIAVKSLLALWVFGTCNVSQPSACSLTSESCSIDAEEPKNVFEKIGQSIGEWGEIFGAIPDRLKSWGDSDFESLKNLPIINPVADNFADLLEDNSKTTAFDIMDTGCVVCQTSYKNQLEAGFFNEHVTYLVVYPISAADDAPRFKNSIIAAKYIIATQIYVYSDENFSFTSPQNFYVSRLVSRLFTEKDDKGISWQTRLNNDLEEQEVVELFSSWLKDFGVAEDEITKITALVDSDEVASALAQNKSVVDNVIHAKSIPTMVYDGKKHNGLFEK